jgi:hypothetical protein
MREGQGIVQTRAFVQFGLVQRLFVDEDPRSSAAGGPHGINFIGDPGRAADRECCVSFARSHTVGLLIAHDRRIRRKSDIEISVCLTSTP